MVRRAIRLARLFHVITAGNGDFNVYLLVAQYNIPININPLIRLSMFDYTAIIVAIITSISTIAGIYLKEWLFPKRKEQKLTIEKVIVI